MNQYPGQTRSLPSELGVRPAARLSTALLGQAFTWMFAGLLLTSGVAYLVQTTPQLYALARDLVLPAIILELAIAFGIQLLIRRISALAALALFFIYAAVNGLTIGLIVGAYTTASVAAAFVSAAGMFGIAAVYGATTKRSLVSIGGYLTMGVFGLLIAMLVNMFLGSGPIGYLISIVGVGIFVVLTAFHVQRITTGDIAAMTGSMEKGAVFSALLLYLDFVNLFLFLLRIFGGSRR